MKAAKEVQRDLEYTQKKMQYVESVSIIGNRPKLTACSALNARAAEKYPEQYRAASRRYPAPVDF